MVRRQVSPSARGHPGEAQAPAQSSDSSPTDRFLSSCPDCPEASMKLAFWLLSPLLDTVSACNLKMKWEVPFVCEGL